MALDCHPPCRHLFPSLFDASPSVNHIGADINACKIKSLLKVSHNPLGLEEERYVIYGGQIVHAYDLIRLHVAEHGDFLFCGGVEGLRNR
jgi:hypothetical protein